LAEFGEEFIKFLNSIGVNITQFDKLVQTAQQFNVVLIDLERTGNIYGKSLKTVRDELNAISVNFSTTQNVAKQYYQLLHELQGIAVKDSKDQLAVLQLVRDAYGPDEQQMQQGIQILQKLISSNSDQQNQIVRIIQLKKMAMDGDTDAIGLLKEQGDRLAGNARLYALLGNESGKTREEIGAMMQFAKSQTEADPLGEIARKFNQAQMQIRNTPAVFQNMIAQIDSEKGKITQVMQGIQSVFSASGAAINETILNMYGESGDKAVSPALAGETDKERAERKAKHAASLIGGSKNLQMGAASRVSALETASLSGNEEAAKAARDSLDEFVNAEKTKITEQLKNKLIEGGMTDQDAAKQAEEDAQKIVDTSGVQNSAFTRFEEQKKYAQEQLSDLSKQIEEGEKELAQREQYVKYNESGSEFTPQAKAQIEAEKARIAALSAAIEAAKRLEVELGKQANADLKSYTERARKLQIDDLITKSLQDQNRELEKQFGTMRGLNNTTASILKLQGELGGASAYSNDAAKTFNELQKQSMDYLGGQIEASRRSYEEVSRFNKLVSEAKTGSQESAKMLAQESIKLGQSQIAELKKALSGASGEQKTQIEASIKHIEERMARANAVIVSDGKGAISEMLRDTSELVDAGMKKAAEAVANSVENIRKSIENARAPAKEITSQLQAQKEVLDAQVSIADNLVTGLGASAEMRMAQAANSMEQAKSMQNELISMQQQRAEVEKKIAEGGDTDGRLIREVMDIRRQENSLAASILQKQKESLDSVKMLREGYLNAISAMEYGSGVFMEMVVTQEKGLGSLIRNIREVPRVLNTGTTVGPGAEKGVFGIGGLMGGTTGARGEYDNNLMINSAQDLSKTTQMLSNAVERFSSALPNMSALGFEGNKFQGAFVAGETGPTTALGARQASSAMQSADLASSFKDALGDQMRPLAEVFKNGLETVFKSAFDEFRKEISDMIGSR